VKDRFSVLVNKFGSLVRAPLISELSIYNDSSLYCVLLYLKQIVLHGLNYCYLRYLIHMRDVSCAQEANVHYFILTIIYFY
jgi:hypothetical protein